MILLAAGLLSRIAALGLVIDMMTAYIVADQQAFFSFFSDPNKFAAADPFIFFGSTNCSKRTRSSWSNSLNPTSLAETHDQEPLHLTFIPRRLPTKNLRTKKNRRRPE